MMQVSSYGEKLLVEQMGTSSCLQHEVSAISAFHNFADFILALTNMDSDGRVLVTSPLGESEGSIKFTMLNAAKHFAEVEYRVLFPGPRFILTPCSATFFDVKHDHHSVL